MDPEAWHDAMTRTGYAAAEPAQYARIMNGILHGVDIDYKGDRSVSRFGANLPVSEEDRPKVSAVIAADVAAGKKAGPFAEQPFPIFNVSPVGAVPKKNTGKIRVIHHLSYPYHGDSINAQTGEEPLTFSSFADAAKAVARLGRGCWLVKLDVEGAYKVIPVRPEDWPLLGFKWNGAYFYERVLPFGLKSSCRIWDWFAAALHYFFEQLGIEVVIHYIDDFLFVIENPLHARMARDHALALCAHLGIPMAAHKTEGPTQCLTFLGIELDSARMRARLPDDKLAELKRLTHDWGRKKTATVKDLQSLAGILNFAASVVRPGRFFIRAIFAQSAAQAKGAVSPHQQWPITDAVRADIAWWSEFAPDWNGISVLYNSEWLQAQRIELFTDACKEGYGARFGTEWFAAKWTDAQRAVAMRLKCESMPYFELYALVAAAATWSHLWRGKKITFRCDCEPVVYTVNGGSSDDPPMMALLRSLALLACRREFDFRCEHIAGKQNVAADILSRDGDCPQFRAVCPDAQATATPIVSPHA